MTADYSVYLVTDRRYARLGRFDEIIESALRGGVSAVQLREKELSGKEFWQSAMEVKGICRQYKVPLIINDRLDIALAVDADGLHLGQSDIPLEIARKVLGTEKIIGISVSNIEQTREALKHAPDYLGVGTVYPTPTKTDTEPPLGLTGLREIRRITALPIVAIGGIKLDNCESIVDAGADGLAVVSGIMAADEPESAARQFRDKLKQAREKKRRE